MNTSGHGRFFRLRSFVIVLLFSLASSFTGQAASHAEDSAQPAGTGGVVGADASNAPPPKSLSPEESAAVEQAHSSGRPVEIGSLIREDSITRAMPDGTFQAEVSSEPVRVKDAEGWHALDPTLTESEVNGQRRLVPRRAMADISLGLGGSNVVAYLGDRKGVAVTQKWPFGTLPEPTVSGRSATYSEVIPGVDLVQLVHPSGVSQVFKVKTKEALNDPRVAQMRLLLKVDGASAKDKGNGKGLVAETPEGRPALHTAEGQWWDSSQRGSTASGPGGKRLTNPLSLSLGSDGGEQVQKLGMDSIASTKNVVFPVYVDPDWTAGWVGSTYVDDGYPSLSYWGGNGFDNLNHVGKLGPPDSGIVQHTQAYYQFNTAFLSGKPIFKAVMNVWEEHAYSCNPRKVSAWVTGGITSSTSWNTRPGNLRNVSTLNIAKGYSSTCPAGSVGFDMGTATSWLTSSPQWTVGLQADDANDAYAWKLFRRTATLIVNYGVKPNTPWLWGISGGLWSPAAGQPGSKYYTRYSAPSYTFNSEGDPDGSLGGNLTATMTVKNSAGTTVLSGTTGVGSWAAGTKFTWQGGTLPDGNYSVVAVMKDPQGLVSNPSNPFYFTVDTTPPGAPTITPSTGISPTGADKGNTNVAPGAGKVQLKLSYAGPYGADRFIYAVSKNGETTAPPASLVSTTSCNIGLGVYRSICAASSALTIDVSPIDDQTTVNVWTVDEAGNVGVRKASTSYAKYTLVNTSPTPVEKVPQLLNVTPSEGAAWVDQDVCVLPMSPSTIGCNLVDKRKVLDLTASTAKADTVIGAADSSQAYTMAAWVKPQGASGTQAIMTQMANSGGPGARLGIVPDGATAQYALTGWSAATTTSSVFANSGVQAGAWKYVVAVNDPANQQLRITITDSDSVTTWVTATGSEKFLAADSTRPVQFGYQSGAPTQVFRGYVYHPVLIPKALSTNEIGNFGQRFEDARTASPNLSDEGLMVK